MKFFFCFYLLASCGLSVGTLIEYTYFSRWIDWNVANWYCRTYYKNLAIINDIGEQQKFVNTTKKLAPCWIGLQRTDVTNNIWKWCNGEAVTYSNWENGSPLLGPATSNCTYVAITGHWNNDFCGNIYPFYCSRYLILVKDSKTWEEARHHCTTNYTGLTSLPYETQVLSAQAELTLTQTDSIWIGLRFMDGKWFWLNGEPLVTLPESGSPPSTPVKLPLCPAQPYCCGALNTKTNVWENRDCNEKLNFLCWN